MYMGLLTFKNKPIKKVKAIKTLTFEFLSEGGQSRTNQYILSVSQVCLDFITSCRADEPGTV